MPFNLNFYSTLLLLGFIQGVIYASLLFYRGFREDKLSDKLLATLLLLICLHISQYMLGFAGWYDSRDAYSSFMFYFPFHNVLLIGPVFYFYFRSLTNDEFQLQRQHFWHFIPGLLQLILYAIIFIKDIVFDHWTQNVELAHHFNTQGQWADARQDYVDGWINNLGTISFVIYLVLTILIYRKYRTYINDNYSDTEAIQFNWIRNILYIVMVAFIFDFLVDMVGNFIEYTDYTSKWRGYFGFAVMTYAISILGYNRAGISKQKLDFDPNEAEAEVTTNANAIPEFDRYKKKLLTLMKDEKLYLQSDLTLKELATQLKTNSSVLSKVINSGFEQNFNDFINSFRVEAVKDKIKSDAAQHLTLTAIAYDCGFNSKATFNRAFKKFTGMSPREFMNQ